MQVSRRERWAPTGKTKTVSATTLGLSRRIMMSITRLGISVASKAKHLDVTFGPGARAREGKTAHSRWTQNAARRARVARLGRRLGKHVFIVGLRPAALYGSSVAAVKAGTIKSMLAVTYQGLDIRSLGQPCPASYSATGMAAGATICVWRHTTFGLSRRCCRRLVRCAYQDRMDVTCGHGGRHSRRDCLGVGCCRAKNCIQAPAGRPPHCHRSRLRLRDANHGWIPWRCLGLRPRAEGH